MLKTTNNVVVDEKVHSRLYVYRTLSTFSATERWRISTLTLLFKVRRLIISPSSTLHSSVIINLFFFKDPSHGYVV